MYSVLNNDEYEFGVNFIYNPSIHYISDDDMELLNYLFGYIKNRGYYYRYNPFELSDRELYSLFDRLVNHDFTIVGYGLIHGVFKGMPTKFSLNSDKDVYRLSKDANNSMDLCRNIINTSLEKGTMDNISCFVIRLN